LFVVTRLEWLKLKGGFEDALFTFLTALSDRDTLRRGRQLRADDHITKPIDFDVLEEIIRARLARSLSVTSRFERQRLDRVLTTGLSFVSVGGGDVPAVPPAAPQRLEQGRRIGKPRGLRLNAVDYRLFIGLLGIEQR
jgi:hypothetical protein